ARVGDLGSVSMSRDELATAGGLEVESIDELERLGLLEGREAGTSVVYDGDALLVARVAARFAEHGFDVRHLRMYLVAAQREAGIIEQMLRPILRDGDGRSRAEVRRLVNELSDAGAALHDLLLRRSLGPFG
ncbi:MAG: MerR family transcriptional regulator, partial [Actinomycetota bacterium]|nr:MerR family transcriptional regulator [Actinomycetota bacterium]